MTGRRSKPLDRLRPGLWGLLLCLFLSTGALAAPTSVRISQIAQAGERLHIYFHFLDEQSNPIDAPEGSTVSVTLGGRPYEGTVSRAADAAVSTGAVFAVDLSTSLDETTFQQVRLALGRWVEAMGETDAAAILTFGDSVKLLTDFTSDKGTLLDLIDGLAPADDTTQLYNGVVSALNTAARQGPALPERRAVIVLTDGIDEAVAGATLKEVTDQVTAAPLPLYIIGFQSRLTPDLSPLDALGTLARQSGGAYIFSQGELGAQYDTAFRQLEQSYLLDICLQPGDLDDSTKGLILSAVLNGVTLEAGADIRLKSFATPESPAPKPEATPEPLSSPEPEPIPLPDPKLLALLGGSGLLALGLVITAVFLVRRRKKRKLEALRRSEEQQKILERALSNNPARPGGTVSNMAPVWGDGGTVILDSHRVHRSAPDLELVEKGSAGIQKHTLSLAVSIRVGRAGSGNTISVQDSAVSSNHFEIVQQERDQKIVIRDLGSSNGTFLERGTNRIRVNKGREEHLLDGDIILAGNTRFEVHMTGLS